MDYFMGALFSSCWIWYFYEFALMRLTRNQFGIVSIITVIITVLFIRYMFSDRFMNKTKRN